MTRLFELLRAGFHERETVAYRVVSSVVWGLILLSVGLLMVELLVPGFGSSSPFIQGVDSVLLVVFAVEFFLRIATYQPLDLHVFRRPPLGRVRVHLFGRLRYLMQPLMLVDLVTVIALVPGMRGLRALRLLRLLRTARFFRYGNPFSGLFHAFERDRLLFLLACSFLLIQVGLGGLSLYLIERGHNPGIESPADAVWCALVTITTVGFGDITPVTSLGRVVAGVLMVGGMFTLATFAGIVSHSLLDAVLSIREEQFRMGNYANHLVVCGYEDGMELLLEELLAEHNYEQTKIVVFAAMARPPQLAPELYWVSGDPTKESELDKVRVAHAAAVLVAGARRVSPQQADAHTLLTLFTIRSFINKQKATSQRHRPLYVVAEILDSENVEHARAAGADEVIETRRLGFSLLAHAIEHHGSADTLSQVVLRGENRLFVGQLPADLRAGTYGSASAALDLRKRGGLLVGVTSSETGEDHVNPPDELPLDEHMHVLYLAREPLLETVD